MKIAVLNNNKTALLGFRLEVLQALLKEHEIIAIAPGGDAGTAKLESMGVHVIDVPLERHGTNPVDDLKLLKLYKSLLRQVKPDVVLTYTIKPNVYGGMACASLGIPCIANITGLGTAVEYEGILQKITVPLYRHGLRKASHVFFQNAENRDFMLKHHVVREGQYTLLPGSGVNLERFPLLPYPDGDTVDFVYVGRLMKEKGVELYFDAAKAIRAKYPNTRFHICGSCEQAYEDQLKELADQDIVIYHGSVSDMPGMYASCQCTIHPSYYPEGMSNVLLESCSCGRPIITTDRSGCREVVEDGVNGYMIPTRDGDALIESIEKFLSLSWEERRDMGLAGRAKVEREFDRQIVVNAYLDELMTIAS